MKVQNETCPTCSDGNGKGYLYAIITAVLCPCHLPLVGMILGSGAAGAFFAQNFMLLAIILGTLTLISFVAAVRILL
jgi:mercuric ion transport protein